MEDFDISKPVPYFLDGTRHLEENFDAGFSW
jgi:hypothetical protein